MAAMLIQTETTPNPATVKFLPGQAVMTSGTRDFATPQEAEASPLAEALFTLGDVTGVFFGRDFISVTAAQHADWPTLKPEVIALLAEHFSAQMPLFRPGSAAVKGCVCTHTCATGGIRIISTRRHHISTCAISSGVVPNSGGSGCSASR